jgi:hypothetical protein
VALWHCPHCGAPQAETARCWVCRKSSTTCSTCRHFRGSLAADLGYCALDRRRQPLTGLELRGCWEGAGARPAVMPAEASSRGVASTAAPPAEVGQSAEPGAWVSVARSFVPLENLVMQAADEAPSVVAAPTVVPPQGIEASGGWVERMSLFGDPEA